MPMIKRHGRSFYYEEAGSQGDPLVFLSGLGGDHRAFNRPQRYFAARFRTLAFDLRDSGRIQQLSQLARQCHDLTGRCFRVPQALI